MYAELSQKERKKLKRAQKRRENRELFKEMDFASDLKKHYGITVEDYNRMLEEQNHCCGCCGKHESEFKRRLHVDHDHTTNQVRGLLCTKCNPGIGYFDDSIEILEMAIAYLKKTKK